MAKRFALRCARNATGRGKKPSRKVSALPRAEVCEALNTGPETVTETASDALGEYLSIPPTIHVDQGKPINVFVRAGLLSVSEETYLAKALGPLSALLDDPSVIEIALNPDGTVWIERSGDTVMRSGDTFLPPNDVRLLATQLAGPKCLGANAPLVTSSRPRGQDVWSVQIVGPPVTTGGYAVSLRRDVLRDVSIKAFDYISTPANIAATPTGRTSPEADLEAGRIAGFFEAAIAARWTF